MPPAIVPAGSAVPMPRATAGCRTVGTFRAATRFPSEAPIRRIVGAPPPLQLKTRQSCLHVPKRIHRTSGPNTEPAGIRRPAACLGGPASRAAHATSGHHALRAGSDEPRRGRDGPSTVSLPPCSRFPTVATYSPNRRTTETRHMNRAFASANATPETLPLSRSEPKPARRARTPRHHTLYDASRQTDVRSPDFDRSIDCRPIWPTFDWQLLY